MQKHKLLLISLSGADGQARKRVEQSGLYEVITLSAADILSGKPESLGISGVVFDCDIVTDPEFEVMSRVAKIFERIAVLVLARELPLYNYQKLGSFQNAATLQKECPTELLESVLSKMVSAQKIEPSRFPRFQTDQGVTLVVLKTGLFVPTQMKNYSAGGAFLSYHGISLKIGDQIQLGIVSKTGDTRRSIVQQMRAKVVWIQQGDGPRSPTRGVGIQFSA